MKKPFCKVTAIPPNLALLRPNLPATQHPGLALFLSFIFFLNKLHNTLGNPYKSLCFCFSPGICPGTAEPSPAQAAATSARGNSSGGTDGTDLSLSHRTCPCHTIPALKSRVTQALVAAPHYGPGDKHGGCCLSLPVNSASLARAPRLL